MHEPWKRTRGTEGRRRTEGIKRNSEVTKRKREKEGQQEERSVLNYAVCAVGADW